MNLIEQYEILVSELSYEKLIRLFINFDNYPKPMHHEDAKIVSMIKNELRNRDNEYDLAIQM